MTARWIIKTHRARIGHGRCRSTCGRNIEPGEQYIVKKLFEPVSKRVYSELKWHVECPVPDSADEHRPIGLTPLVTSWNAKVQHRAQFQNARANNTTFGTLCGKRAWSVSEEQEQTRLGVGQTPVSDLPMCAPCERRLRA